jgi:hypothetical protein
MSKNYARRQLMTKKKKEEEFDPLTDKEEWENEYDDETMYENPFP